MKIYEPVSRLDHEFCELCDVPPGELKSRGLLDRNRNLPWEPPSVEIVAVDELGCRLKYSDIMLAGPMSALLVVRGSALANCGNFLRETGELRPLRCEQGEVYLFNPNSMVGALDESRSLVWRHDDGRLMSIRRYIFVATRLESIDVFRIPNLSISPLFFSDRAIGRLQSAGLQLGISFMEVWSNSEEGTIGQADNG